MCVPTSAYPHNFHIRAPCFPPNNIHRHTQTSNMYSRPHSMYTHPVFSAQITHVPCTNTHTSVHRHNHIHTTHIQPQIHTTYTHCIHTHPTLPQTHIHEYTLSIYTHAVHIHTHSHRHMIHRCTTTNTHTYMTTLWHEDEQKY